MPRFAGFLGQTYTGRNDSADAERAINLYVESVESQTGRTKTDYTMLSKPGLTAFAATGASSVPAMASLNGRCFAVVQSGTTNSFVEILANGTVTAYTPALAGDTRPQMCASQTQVLILSGGLGYVFTLGTNTLQSLASLASAAAFPIGATKVDFLDGYFIVLEPNSQTFAISALNDGTSWDGLDFGDAEGEPGNVVSMIVDHRQVWFLGTTHGEVYFDSGNANFPLSRLEGAFMEQGCGAIDSLVKCDNTIFWLSQNRDGQGMVWRANGYTPERVSTYAIETIIAEFGAISDARGYTYQDSGHTFYVLHFPSANQGIGATLVYDVGEKLWHERGWWDSTLGAYRGDLARSHAFCFGMHLVGDYRSGTIYQQSMDLYTDNGNPIRRLRAAPDLANGGKYTYYGEMRLLMSVGVGLDGNG